MCCGYWGRIQHRQQRAPRIADEPHLFDPDVAPHRLDICDVNRDGRGRFPLGLRRAIRPALIVVIDASARSQVGNGVELGTQVAAVRARSPVEDQDRRLAGSGGEAGFDPLDVKVGLVNGKEVLGHAARPLKNRAIGRTNGRLADRRNAEATSPS